MVSDSDMSTESSGTEEEMEEEQGHQGSGGTSYSAGEEGATGQAESGVMAGETGQVAGEAAKPKSRGGGRRAALRILRENVDSVSKDIANFRKTHEASSKKIEKQVSSIKNEVASLKSFFAKENAKLRSKQEAQLSKIIAKLNAPKPKAPPRSKKKAGGKKSKGRK